LKALRWEESSFVNSARLKALATRPANAKFEHFEKDNTPLRRKGKKKKNLNMLKHELGIDDFIKLLSQNIGEETEKKLERKMIR